MYTICMCQTAAGTALSKCNILYYNARAGAVQVVLVGGVCVYVFLFPQNP